MISCDMCGKSEGVVYLLQFERVVRDRDEKGKEELVRVQDSVELCLKCIDKLKAKNRKR